ncbi:MAG: alpha/beta hydrolase [Planctomycetota bacterium]
MSSRTLAAIVALGMAACVAYAQMPRPHEVADVPSQDLLAGQNAYMRYFLVGPKEGAQPPEEGYGLLVVVPGGSGSEGFLTFVKGLHKNALGDDYLAAQLVAVQQIPTQNVVWPTRASALPGLAFRTEDFVRAVVEDVKLRHKVDPRRIFALAWTTGAPAAYSLSLQEGTPLAGTFIAMSEFKAHTLPNLKRAKGHAYLLYHSPQDQVVPIGMAKGAQFMLQQNEAKVKLATYEGGHGWRGEFYGDIHQGIQWLEAAAEPEPESEEKIATPEEAEEEEEGPILMSDSFEWGEQAPVGWYGRKVGPTVSYAWARGTAVEGKASLTIAKKFSRQPVKAQWVRREVPRKHKRPRLQIALYIRLLHGASGTVDLRFFDAKRKLISEDRARLVARDKVEEWAVRRGQGWKRYIGTVSIPEEAKFIGVALGVEHPGRAWFDKLEVRYAGSPPAPGGTRPEKSAQAP